MGRPRTASWNLAEANHWETIIKRFGEQAGINIEQITGSISQSHKWGKATNLLPGSGGMKRSGILRCSLPVGPKPDG